MPRIIPTAVIAGDVRVGSRTALPAVATGEGGSIAFANPKSSTFTVQSVSADDESLRPRRSSARGGAAPRALSMMFAGLRSR